MKPDFHTVSGFPIEKSDNFIIIKVQLSSQGEFMKKTGFILIVLLAACLMFACKSGPKIDGEVTQEKVNDALGQIYDTYRPRLDLTGAQEYTVKSGDTLSAITRQFYGSVTGVGTAGPNNGFYFPVIMAASDSHIVDPDLIEPGMKLVIPDLKKNYDSPAAKSAIKDCLNDVAVIYNHKGVTATETGLKNLADSL
jgi:hypothetical protein